MIRKAFIAASMAAFAIAGAAGAAQPDDYVGYWKAKDDNAVVKYLQLKLHNGKPKMRAVGQCPTGECEWGTVDAMAFSSQRNASLEQDVAAVGGLFSQSYGRSIVIVEGDDGDELEVTVYAAQPKTSFVKTYEFVPAPELQGR